MQCDFSTEVLREEVKINRVQLSDDFLFQFTLDWREPCRFQGRRFATLGSCHDLDEARLILGRTRRMMHDALRPWTKIVEPPEIAPGK